MTATELRYLEGRSAITERINVLTGRNPNAEQAAFASACLLHGRLFWNSAEDAPLETKPLLLYYGAAAYAKGLVLAVTGCKPQDLKQSHGLKCAAVNGELIGDFNIKANGRGLFQEFNDAVAPMNRIQYFEGSSSRTRTFPTATSEELSTFTAPLTDCLARIPSLKDAYQLCTRKEAKTISLLFSDISQPPWTHTIRVDVPQLFNGLTSLRAIATDIREKVPLLRHWRLSDATKAWDNTVPTFGNACAPVNEFDQLQGGPEYFACVPSVGTDLFDPFDFMEPLAGGYGSCGAGAAYIETMDGKHVSEYSLMLATLHGLSSLVRYHPHTWTSCVSRRSISGRCVDDSLLPVIELFLDNVQHQFPKFIADVILGR